MKDFYNNYYNYKNNTIKLIIYKININFTFFKTIYFYIIILIFLKKYINMI